MSALFSVAIFFAVIALAGVLFSVWLIVMIGRGLIGGRSSMLHRNHRPTPLVPVTVRCTTRGCMAMNPPDARFCRRCGRGLPGAHRAQVRRAAVW